MITRSRNRGYSADRIIDTAVVITVRASNRTGNSSQVHIGSTPNARMNTNATSRFGSRLNRLVSTVASGITRRGNCVLRITDSLPTIDPTAVIVASWKNPKSTMSNSRNTG